MLLIEGPSFGHRQDFFHTMFSARVWSVSQPKNMPHVLVPGELLALDPEGRAGPWRPRRRRLRTARAREAEGSRRHDPAETSPPFCAVVFRFETVGMKACVCVFLCDRGVRLVLKAFLVHLCPRDCQHNKPSSSVQASNLCSPRPT